MTARHARPAVHGFTLVEVLVAITVLAIIALFSWRGIDGMARTQGRAQAYTDEVMALNAAISQWKTDLDHQIPPLNPSAIAQEPMAMFWDGRSMRITRHSSVDTAEGLRVVAWARQADSGTGVWRRWQSGPLTTIGAWRSAWEMAGQWAAQGSASTSNPSQVQATTLMPLLDWQISYYRGDAWTNALSSGTTQQQTGDENTGTAVRTQRQGQADGVRLTLVLPSGGDALSGTLTVDWVRPTRGGGQ